jgi:hypothetical protein
MSVKTFVRGANHLNCGKTNFVIWLDLSGKNCHQKCRYGVRFCSTFSLQSCMDKSKEECIEIIPRLGLCYAILMQTRNKDLSLVQRLNTVLLTNGNAKKEVCLITDNVTRVYILYSIVHAF